MSRSSCKNALLLSVCIVSLFVSAGCPEKEAPTDRKISSRSKQITSRSKTPTPTPTPTPAAPNSPPVINSFTTAKTEIFLPCPVGNSSCGTDNNVGINIAASDPDGDELTYNFTVAGGRVYKQNGNWVWQLDVTQPGSYSITVEVSDGEHTVTRTAEVKVINCPSCAPACRSNVEIVNCPLNNTIRTGQTVDLEVSGSGSSADFMWFDLENGDMDDTHSARVTLKTSGKSGKRASVKVQFADAGPSCTPAACSFILK
jgi:hypothetical protein